MSKVYATTQINVHTPEPTDYEVKRVYKEKRRFSMTKQFNTLKSPGNDKDILDLFGDMPKASRDLFLEIKNSMDYKTNTCTLDNSALTKAQKNKKNIAYNKLKDVLLVKKIPTKGIKNIDEVALLYPVNTFMVSPIYIIPSSDFIESITHIWRNI